MSESSISTDKFATGYCLCGEVQFTISSAPLRMGQCHCDDCRRSTGTGHGYNNAAENIIAISAGSLNESQWFKADAIVYNKSKPVWDFMDESIPTFEEMPPAPGK